MPEIVNFKTNAQLKSIIGKDLITDDNLAILELVKNSFDANARKVKIEFKKIILSEPLKKYKAANKSRVVVSDNGVGMSNLDLKDKWLNIAYSDKKDNNQKYGRSLAGNKGVGRFSCDRLGRQLTLITRKKGSKIIRFDIDWTLFEGINQVDFQIQNVDIQLDDSLSERDVCADYNLSKFKQGTILDIHDLREYWSESSLLSLRRDLERFINPNQAFEDEGFKIEVVANEFKKSDEKKEEFRKINGLVENKIFEKLDFKVTSMHASINKAGNFIDSTLTDRGKSIFSLKEKNPFPNLKDIDIYIYYLNPYSKAYFTKQTGIRSVDFGSIFLFINGFRVPPYGDRDDDWLQMDDRKNQGRTRRLGNREVIGRIEIKNNDENSEDDESYFKVISNRSGVVKNKVFNELTKKDKPYGLYYRVFRRLERFVVEGIEWDSIPDSNYQALEKEILNDPDWTEDKERYKIDSLTRSKNILKIVKKIIDVRDDDIINLEVHNEFVESVIDEQAEKVSKDIDKILKQVEKSNLSPDDLAQFLKQLQGDQEELTVFQKSLSNINSESKSIDKVSRRLVTQLKYVTRERDKAVDAAKRAIQAKESLESEIKQLNKELDDEKSQNKYLLTSSRELSQDAKGLVHNIKITSKKINDGIDNLYAKIVNESASIDTILRSLAAIKFQSEKVLKISNIITRSNFQTEKTSQIVDIVTYIVEYIGVYQDIYSSTDVSFELEICDDCEMIKKVSVLDVSVLLDDLISNSIKAGATLVQFKFEMVEDKLEIYVSDNGRGVNKQFLDNPERIFKLGVTTTTGGSGIGLNSVKTALKSMNGKIDFIGNKVLMDGATFKITL